jgi:hypothetical protein
LHPLRFFSASFAVKNNRKEHKGCLLAVSFFAKCAKEFFLPPWCVSARTTTIYDHRAIP